MQAGIKIHGFQSTLPIREETLAQQHPAPLALISIHSSHTGRDPKSRASPKGPAHFNPLFPYGKRPHLADALAGVGGISIHSSHTGRDYIHSSPCPAGTGFQSTLPIREETAARSASPPDMRFQSTLPIREETDNIRQFASFAKISIHSSHTGRDGMGFCMAVRATISIHSSHTGRDAPPATWFTVPAHFNPLFPYGKRPHTPPLRRCVPISIHSSHTGRDGQNHVADFDIAKFQSTLPIREETKYSALASFAK